MAEVNIDITPVTVEVVIPNQITIEIDNLPIKVETTRMVTDTVMDSECYFELGENLTAYKVVLCRPDGKIYHADKDVADRQSVIGVLISGGVTGQQKPVKVAGTLQNVGWNFEPGKRIFLGNNGELTQTVPTTGLLKEIGTALESTKIIIDIEEGIML